MIKKKKCLFPKNEYINAFPIKKEKISAKLSIQILIVFALIFLFATSGFSADPLLEESFESGTGQTPPAGWSVVSNCTDIVYFNTVGTQPACSPYEGSKLVEYQTYGIAPGCYYRLRLDTPFSTVGWEGVTVAFEWHEDPGAPEAQDKVSVMWSTDGSSWNVAEEFRRYNPVAGWKFKMVVLPAGADEQENLHIAFTVSSDNGNNCHLDFVQVIASSTTPPVTLTVNKTGAGEGRVTSMPPGIDCGSTCSADYTVRTDVTLTATPSPGSVFVGWGGDCSGTNASTSITMYSAQACTARFEPEKSTAIPTLSEWGMIIFSLMLAGSAIWMIRRRQVS